MKICTKCNQEKQLEKFRVKRGACKKCESLYNNKFFKSDFGKEYRRQWQENERRTKPTLGMFRAAKKRAKEQNVPFDITIEDIIVPEYCPILGIKLQFNVGLSKDNSPTLDKIIPSLGYVKGNIAVISKRANTIKNDASIEDIEKVFNWLKTKSK
jgi:tRNA G26 N,N-dimethylase Trm1